MKFEWDKQKAKLNLSKHGISFDQAQTVFDDPLYQVTKQELIAYQED